MSALRIQLLGGLRVAREDQPLPPFPTQKARALFAFLVLNRGRLHSREVLIGHFWGDRPEGVARKCLRTDIWRVRGVVESGAAEDTEHLQVEGDQLGFDAGEGHWVDVEAFEGHVRAARGASSGELGEHEAGRLAAAVDLYRGDLLEGFYDDWCLYERERLRLLYLAAMERLMEHHQRRREWREAISLGQRLLGTDPLLEHVHRELMRCYLGQGNRPAALRQFATCARVLRAELDVEPMPETSRVHEEIRADVGAPLEIGEPDVTGWDERDRSRALLEQMDTTLSVLRSATRELEAARSALGREVASREDLVHL